jgi:hypothetical protein
MVEEQKVSIMENNKQLILIKSEDNSCLIESAMQICNLSSSNNMLFLSHKEVSFVQDSIKQLKHTEEAFNSEAIRFMFLKQTWSVLDEMYGKTFFINEIQKMMKEEEFSILYFHRADTFFEGCTKRDMDRIISDIIEIARYYHKMVIFSVGVQNRLGQIIDEVLYKEVDVEYLVKRDKIGVCKHRILKSKKDNANIILFSDKKDVIDLHKYIFKKDTHIHFNHVSELDENQLLVEEADIVIFNLHNIPFKDKLLSLIKKRKLRTKFLFLSDDVVIRKRDKVRKIEKGISQVFEKNFDLSEYIYTIEKIIGRNFYTTILDRVNILPRNHYLTEEEILKDTVYSFLNYHIYFSMVAVEYSSVKPISLDIIENCIRDIDLVYHNEKDKNLIFLLVDILPKRALSLVTGRLDDRDIEVVSKQAFNVNECFHMLGIKKKQASKQSDTVDD